MNALLFHRISGGREMHSEIQPEFFAYCLELVRDAGLPVWTLAECGEADSPQRSDVLCLTFDDGWESDVTVALPELARRRFRGTFFITTENVGTGRFLSWPQVRELADAGMEVGSHTCSHADLTQLPLDDLRKELRVSRQELEHRLGRRVVSLSVPRGTYNQRVLGAAREAGYAHVCVSRPGLNGLPLGRDRPVRRNALHGAMGKTDLPRILHPGRAALIGWQVGYASRAALKGVLSEGQYERLRRVVTAYFSRDH